MPEVTKEWVQGLNERALERVLALGLYHYRSQLLFIHTDEWWQLMFRGDKTAEEKQEIFSDFLSHYLLMWGSMIYVVHEGFVELGIEDAALTKALNKVGVDVLKRFRNATFYYQPRVRDPRHGAMFELKRFGAMRSLYERQGVLVRRMRRFLKGNPLYGTQHYA
jgi:hypothetical protein